MSYSYDRRIAKKFEPSWYGLEGLIEGRPTKLYHGSTRLFTKFDMALAREELVNNYYGVGIFFTPSKRVAEKYAGANRNIGFDPSIISDLKAKNRNAGEFLEVLVREGSAAWETFAKKHGFIRDNPSPGEGSFDVVGFEDFLGVDPNTVGDIAALVIGSKVQRLGGDEPVNIFNMSSGLPDWAYSQLDELGLNSNTYRPKVYTVIVQVSNPLITARKDQARRARSQGYDSVIFHGADLVDGIPEVAVFDPKAARVQGYDIV